MSDVTQKNRSTKYCNTPLLKTVHTKHRKILKPIKVFPYQSLENAMTRLLSSKDFITQCEQWRERAACIPDGILGDVYDGKVWQEFCSEDKGHFYLHHSLTCYVLTLTGFNHFQDWFIRLV